MMKSGKIEVEEEVIRTYMLDFLRYGGKRSISSFKNFMNLTVLSGYLTECTIVGYQTQ